MVKSRFFLNGLASLTKRLAIILEDLMFLLTRVFIFELNHGRSLLSTRNILQDKKLFSILTEAAIGDVL